MQAPPTVARDHHRVSTACGALLRHQRFQVLSMSVIVFNAAILGAMTFPALTDAAGGFLHWADYACLAFFTFEVALGIASFGPKPWRYFREGWNIFDFAIVVASFLPGLHVTILRMLRLARVVRILRSMPSLRIIVVAAGKALPKSAGVFALTGLVMYLWAMVGWIAFEDSDTEHFGTVGKALLNLFQLVAFDDMGNVIRSSMAENVWTLPYYVVFILFGAFILVNIMIGVVLASMEEAQKMDDEDGQVSADTAIMLDRLDKLQTAVDKLTAEQETRREYTPFR